MMKFMFMLMWLPYMKMFSFVPLMGSLIILLLQQPINTTSSMSGFELDDISYLMILVTIWITSTTSYCSIMKMNFYIMWSMVLCVVTFMCSSVILFYMSYELAMVPMLILMMQWGYQPERTSSTIYLVVFTILSGAPFLICSLMCSSVWMFFHLSTFNKVSDLLSIMLVTSFMVKTPLYLVHVWLPKAHVESPTSGSVLLAAIYLKLGGYGLFRLGNELSFICTVYMIGVCMLGVMMMSITFMSHTDLKYLVAISSIIHMNMSVSQILSNSSGGAASACLSMLSHSYISGCMFFMVGEIATASNSRNLLVVGKMMGVSRVWTFIVLLTFFANLGLPPFLSFYVEILTIMQFTNSMICLLVWSISFLIMSGQVLLIIVILHSSLQHVNSAFIRMSFLLTYFNLMMPSMAFTMVI